jgi:hypothetical protein
LYMAHVDYPEMFQLPQISAEAAVFSHLGFHP